MEGEDEPMGIVCPPQFGGGVTISRDRREKIISLPSARNYEFAAHLLVAFRTCIYEKGKSERKGKKPEWKIRIKGIGVREGEERKEERADVSRFVFSPPPFF
jgi:hypothetical protein